MNTPRTVIIGIVVVILGFLVFYSQQRETPKQAAPASGQPVAASAAPAAGAVAAADGGAHGK